MKNERYESLIMCYDELRSKGMHHGETLREFLAEKAKRDKDLQAKIAAYDELRSKGMHHGETLQEYLRG